MERLRNYVSDTVLCKAETAKGKRYKEQLDLQMPFPHTYPRDFSQAPYHRRFILWEKIAKGQIKAVDLKQGDE